MPPQTPPSPPSGVQSTNTDPTLSPSPLPEPTPPTKSNKGLVIGLAVFLLVVIAGIGALLYLNSQKEEDNVVTPATSETQKETAPEASTLVAKWEYSAEERAAAEAFVQKYNNEWFSRGECDGLPVEMYDVHVDDYQIVARFRCQGYSVNGLTVFERSHTSDKDWDQKLSIQNELLSVFPEWVYDQDPTFYDTVYGINKND